MPIEPIFWNWLILACIFLVLETLSASFFFIFWAMAAILLAIVTWLMPNVPLAWQALCFSILSIISIGIWWKVTRQWQNNKNDDASLLNHRGKQLIGRQFMLQSPIIGGFGRLQIDDSLWTIRGEDMPSGTVIIIVDVKSMELVVSQSSNQ